MLKSLLLQFGTAHTVLLCLRNIFSLHMTFDGRLKKNHYCGNVHQHFGGDDASVFMDIFTTPPCWVIILIIQYIWGHRTLTFKFPHEYNFVIMIVCFYTLLGKVFWNIWRSTAAQCYSYKMWLENNVNCGGMDMEGHQEHWQGWFLIPIPHDHGNIFSHARGSRDGNVGLSVGLSFSWSTTLVQVQMSQQLWVDWHDIWSIYSWCKED